MRKNYLYFLLSASLLYISCGQTPPPATNSIAPAIKEDPVVNPADALKDVMSLLYYQRDFLKLADDFIAYNADSQIIDKGTFLQQLTTGNYLPLRLADKNDSSRYRLYRLDTPVSKDIRSVIQQWGDEYYTHYKMEGKPLPGINYTDLNNTIYNTATTRGKVLVLKCWFIACQACNEEIPALNNIVAKYKNRKDILFVSLALDSKPALEAFLKKTTFGYAVVPDQESYLIKTLKITTYPTHILINRQGLVTKVVNGYEEMLPALRKELAE